MRKLHGWSFSFAAIMVSVATGVCLMWAGVAPPVAHAGLSSALHFPPLEKAEPHVYMTEKDCRDFVSVFALLARQGDVVFVAEGEPLHETGVVTASSKASHPTLANVVRELSEVSGGVPLNEAVTKIASVFDYDVERSKNGGAFLLRKRYINESDLPCITLPEISASLRDVERILARVNPPSGAAQRREDRTYRYFLLTLSEDQVKQMASADGLPASALSQAQQDTAYHRTLSAFMATSLQGMEMAVKESKQINEKDTTFCIGSVERFNHSQVQAFGYRTRYKSSAFLSPLSRADVFTTQLGVRMEFTANNVIKNALPDPTNPTDAEAAWAKKSVYSVTLGQIADALGQPGAAVVADETVTDKVVTLVDANSVSSGNGKTLDEIKHRVNAVRQRIGRVSLLQAVADVYELRLSGDTVHDLRLERRPIKLPNTATKAQTELVKAMPAPLLRSFRSGRTAQTSRVAEWDKEGMKLPEAERKAYYEVAAGKIQRVAGKRSASVLRLLAVRRLRLLLEPRLQNGMEIPINDAGAEERGKADVRRVGWRIRFGHH